MLIRIFFISRRLGSSSSASRVTVVPLQASSKSSSAMFGFFEVFGLFSVEPRSPCLCFLVSGIRLELVKEKCLQFEMIYLDRFLLHEGRLFWRSTLAHEKYVLTPWCTSPRSFTSGENVKPQFLHQYLVFCSEIRDYSSTITFTQLSNLKKIADLKVYGNHNGCFPDDSP